MVIPSFRGNKGENFEIFLKEYMKACIGIRLVLLWCGILVIDRQ
jgi:hypothetical protein